MRVRSRRQRSDEASTGGVNVERAGMGGVEAVLYYGSCRRGDILRRVCGYDDEIEFMWLHASPPQGSLCCANHQVSGALLFPTPTSFPNRKVLNEPRVDIFPKEIIEVLVRNHSLRSVHPRGEDSGIPLHRFGNL